MKVTGAGVAGLTLSQLGLDLEPVRAYASGLKIDGAKDIVTVCPYCSVGCHIIASVKDGRLVSTEGDPDCPINEGGLCAKGAAMLSITRNERRVTHPLYRAPGSTQWEEKSWEWMYERIARRVKETRDKDFIAKNEKGQTVNRIESMFFAGSSHADNEECAAITQMVRGLGIVHYDHQARVCHSSTVASLAESFGRGAMTNHYIDIKNADAVLIMGSNCAEHHPVTFKWVLKAKDNGAAVIHVDPKFSRTSARSDFHVPLRSGTDIAFLGGMIKYIIDNERYFKEYLVEYTNAANIVNGKYGFKDGLFSGFDAAARKYDNASWSFEMDGAGVPRRDKTLADPRCVFQLMKKHYSRYDMDKVSSVTGVSKANLLKVYDIYTKTGVPDKAGTMIYALGWTQHTVGVQNIRAAGIVQLLLGNVGIPGGGINALRGEPNVQGSTDHAVLYHILPGYHATPVADWQTLEDYNKANTPVSKDPASANYWQNRPKFMASLLKGWYGENAAKENDFRYGLLPKGEKGEDYSYMYLFDRMYKGKIRGGFIFGVNSMNSLPNTTKARAAMDNLDWVVVSELHHTETTDHWRRPDIDPHSNKTEYFFLPSAHRIEKDGTVSNSGRWVLWHHKAIEPAGESRPFGDMIVGIMNTLRDAYRKEGGRCPRRCCSRTGPRPTIPTSGRSGSTAASRRKRPSAERPTRRGSSCPPSPPWPPTAPRRA